MQCGTCHTVLVMKADAVQQVRAMQKMPVAMAILEMAEVVAEVVVVGAAQAGDVSYF
jgi:hypothetical protein